MTRIGRLAVLVTVLLVGTSSLALAASKMLANAVVKSISATSLTATAEGKDMTFSVNAKTHVVGKGMGTKGASKGGKPMITDLLKEGDRVSITYTDGATPVATKVEVAAK
jgi:hypothetical protein